MRKSTAIVSVLAALTLSGSVSRAQEFRTGYFLDNNIYSYRYNAALYASDDPKGFFGIGIGNVTASADASQGFSDFFFPKNGRLYTGLSREVGAREFTDRLGPSTILNAEVNQNIIAVGWKGEKFYNTIEINARSSNYGNVDNDIFRLLKNGGGIAGIYDAAGSNISSRNWMEIAYGMSVKLPLGFRVGYRLKGLIGIASANARINSLAGKSTSDGYVDIDSGTGILNFSGIVSPVIDESGILTGFTTIGNTLGGGGAAVDLGLHWESAFGLSANIGINDVGGIIWADQHVADMTSKAVSTRDNIDIDLDKLVKYSDRGNIGTTSVTVLPMTLNAGIKYSLPFYKRFSLGALANFRFGDYKWSEGRLAMTITPVDIISITGNVAVNTFGWGYGAAINLRIPIVNIFLGAEMNDNKFSPQGILLAPAHLTVNAGLSFVIK